MLLILNLLSLNSVANPEPVARSLLLILNLLITSFLNEFKSMHRAVGAADNNL